MLKILEEAIPEEVCKKVIDLYHSDPMFKEYRDDKREENFNYSVREVNIPLEDEDWEFVKTEIAPLVDMHVTQELVEHLAPTGDTKLDSVAMMHQCSGQSLPLHYDSPIMNKQGVGKIRHLVVFVYLNDVESGGEIVFPTLKSDPIAPAPGKLIIFPASYAFPHYTNSTWRDRYVLRFNYVANIDKFNLGRIDV